MKAKFTIEYQTRWGESLVLVADGKTYPMTWGKGGLWSVEIDPCPAALPGKYGYEVLCDGLVVRQEWSSHSRSPKRGETEFRDSWIDPPAGAAFRPSRSASRYP